MGQTSLPFFRIISWSLNDLRRYIRNLGDAMVCDNRILIYVLPGSPDATFHRVTAVHRGEKMYRPGIPTQQFPMAIAVNSEVFSKVAGTCFHVSLCCPQAFKIVCLEGQNPPSQKSACSQANVEPNLALFQKGSGLLQGIFHASSDMPGPGLT